MELTLHTHLVLGPHVPSNSEVFPVVVEIRSDKRQEIAEKIDIIGAWLDSAEDPDLSYGYSASGRVGILGNEITIGPRRSKYVCIDVLEVEERKGDLQPGKLRLTIDICVFLKQGQNFQPLKLSAISEICVSKE